LASELIELGEDVSVVALFVEPDGLPDECQRIPYVLPNHFFQEMCSRSKAAFFLLGPFILFWLLMRNAQGTDLLNPHNFPASWIAVLVGSLRGIPVLWTCNEPPTRISWKDAKSVGIGDFLGWWVASGPLDRLIVKQISAIHVLSEKTRQEVMDRYQRDSTVLRTGVDWEHLHPASRVDAVTKYALEDRFVLLTVGKLHPQKNQVLCLETLRDLVWRISNAVLLVVGEGPMLHELRNMARAMGIEQYVRFLGRVPLVDLCALYGASDTVLFPALNQSWGLTPFEALCARRVTVVCADSGAAEVLGTMGIGLVAEPTPSAFAACVMQIHERPGRFADMASAGRDYVVRNLTPRVFATRFLGLAEQVRNSKGLPSATGHRSESGAGS
jgi:glycosyltransferase involved in cell wall biosynthesis